MKPFAANNAHVELQSETTGVRSLRKPVDLATKIGWCGPNVWLKTGTGRFARPNTAANLRDPYEANFLIG